MVSQGVHMFSPSLTEVSSRSSIPMVFSHHATMSVFLLRLMLRSLNPGMIVGHLCLFDCATHEGSDHCEFWRKTQHVERSNNKQKDFFNRLKTCETLAKFKGPRYDIATRSKWQSYGVRFTNPSDLLGKLTFFSAPSSSATGKSRPAKYCALSWCSLRDLQNKAQLFDKRAIPSCYKTRLIKFSNIFVSPRLEPSAVCGKLPLSAGTTYLDSGRNGIKFRGALPDWLQWKFWHNVSTWFWKRKVHDWQLWQWQCDNRYTDPLCSYTVVYYFGSGSIMIMTSHCHDSLKTCEVR